MPTHETMASAADPSLEHLRKQVRTHKLCYELSLEQAVDEGKVKAVGFEIDLYATHDHPAYPPMPGCSECVPVLAALQEVLDFVLPERTERTSSTVHTAGGFSSSAARHHRLDIKATVLIDHLGDVLAPIDPCEQSCRDKMLARLQQLGACEKRWVEPEGHSG